MQITGSFSWNGWNITKIYSLFIYIIPVLVYIFKISTEVWHLDWFWVWWLKWCGIKQWRLKTRSPFYLHKCMPNFAPKRIKWLENVSWSIQHIIFLQKHGENMMELFKTLSFTEISTLFFNISGMTEWQYIQN